MKEFVYAIGDIHGEYQMFQQLLEDYQPEIHQLVLIGDLSDRGKQSKNSLLLGKKLVEEEGAIYLRGNHEEIFLNFIKEPEERFDNYIRNGGKETIDDLLHPGATVEYSPTEISLMIRSRYKELLVFLSNLPYFYEWNNYIFVHAGIDLSKKNWQDTSNHDFIWIREPFHTGKNQTGKRIVFGHTITPSLYGDGQTTRIWQSDNKIGIDGGGVYGGAIHGVIFNKEGILQDIEVAKVEEPWNPDL